MAVLPLVAVSAPTWAFVVARFGGQCCCTGQCGRKHPDRTAGRCPVGPAFGDRLYAAPADPSIPAAKAHEVPAADLAAWCGPCMDAGRRTAAKTESESAPEGASLFDL